MLVTIELIAGGEDNKGLFKGLHIYTSSHVWETFGVISLSFSGTDSKEPFKQQMINEITLSIDDNKIKYPELNVEIITKYETISHFLRRYILELERVSGNKIIILIDELDTPLTKAFLDADACEDINIYYSIMFETFKKETASIKFLVCCGITKIAIKGVSNGKSFMKDLSLSEEYAELTGFTEGEVKKYFGKRLKNISEGLSNSQLGNLITIYNELKKKKEIKDDNDINICLETISSEEREMLVWMGIKHYYSGYVFNSKLPSLYNPYALIEFLTNEEFGDYWFLRSGEGDMVRYVMIRDKISDFFLMSNLQSERGMTRALDVREMTINTLLFQVGLVTIQHKVENIEGNRVFGLGCPNLYAKGILLMLKPTNNMDYQIIKECKMLRGAIERREFPEALLKLEDIFYMFKYQVMMTSNEAQYRNFIFFFLLVGELGTILEDPKGKGVCDITFTIGVEFYAFELKLNRSGQEALECGLSKKYLTNLPEGVKRATIFGCNYTTNNRNIGYSPSGKMDVMIAEYDRNLKLLKSNHEIPTERASVAEIRANLASEQEIQRMMKSSVVDNLWEIEDNDKNRDMKIKEKKRIQRDLNMNLRRVVMDREKLKDDLEAELKELYENKLTPSITAEEVQELKQYFNSQFIDRQAKIHKDAKLEMENLEKKAEKDVEKAKKDMEGKGIDESKVVGNSVGLNFDDVRISSSVDEDKDM